MSGVVFSVSQPHLYADEIVVITDGGFKCCPLDLAVTSGDFSVTEPPRNFYGSAVWSDFLHCSFLKAISPLFFPQSHLLPFFKTCRSSLEAIHYSALLVAPIADAYAGSGYYRKTSDGCDGKAVGFGGSLRPKSLGDILKLMKIVGKRVVGLGAGDGRVLAAALVLGAQSAVGCELPGNIAQKFVFDAVIFRMISSSAAESCHCKGTGSTSKRLISSLFSSLRQN